MTNREYLNSLSDAEFVAWILQDSRRIASNYIDSQEGMTKWMSQEIMLSRKDYDEQWKRIFIGE